MDSQMVEDIIKRYPGHKMVLLAPNPGAAVQLKEGKAFMDAESAPLTATPLELALEVLEPDIKMRGLKLITDEKIIHILERITASLNERGELSRYGGLGQIASLLPGVYESIIKMRRSAPGAQVLASDWGDTGSDLLGRIRNEYELSLEVWGCLDEASAFCQAASILEAGMIDGAGRIIVVTRETEFAPVVLSFLKALMEHGCEMCFGMDLLLPCSDS